MTHLNSILSLMEPVMQMPRSDKKDAGDGEVEAALKGLGRRFKKNKVTLLSSLNSLLVSIYFNHIQTSCKCQEVLIMRRKREAVKAALAAPSRGLTASPEGTRHKVP